MELVTVFLIVLVLALVIGNALLFLFPKNPVSGAEALDFGLGTDSGSLKFGGLPEQSIGLDSEIKAVHEKVRMAHSRIGMLERAIASNNGTLSPSVEEKLRRLDHFRANTQVELVAMREILAELQNIGLVVRAKRFERKKNGRKKSAPEISPHEMHSIIYRSNNKGKK